MDRLDPVLRQMEKTITFLRQNGIIHFDCHHWNILTDGQKVYLADFGLVLDRNFNLNKREREFFRQNTHYDYGEFLCGLGGYMSRKYRKLTDNQRKSIRCKYGLEDKNQHHKLSTVLRENIVEIYADGTMKLDKGYVDAVITYQGIITLMENFFRGMGRNNRKNTRYSHTRLRRLLKETKFIQ